MQIDFFDSYPHEHFEPELRSLVAQAQRLDAAIAFVTRGGTTVLREFLNTHPPDRARIVASIRFPTSLTELMHLAGLMSGNVFIHTGFRTPEERKAERGQFHSKVVLLELAGDQRCVIVCSHNWTQNALHGHNLEAGVIIRCVEADPIVGQARDHINACAARSELFDPKRLRFYEAVQRDLHVRPPTVTSEDFPGFQQCDALIIHAEDAIGGTTPDPLQLFVPVRELLPNDFFTVEQRVLLYLYPAGSLIGKAPPTGTPRLYEGAVTMNNFVRDAPVERRDASTQIGDLDRPRVELLPAGNVPLPTGERSQVMIRLQGRDLEEIPLFHAAVQSPKIKVAVAYQRVDPDDADPERMLKRRRREDQRNPSDFGDAIAPPEFRFPHHLIFRTAVQVPSPDLYPRQIKQQLNSALWGSRLINPEDEPDVVFEGAPRQTVLNRYVYRVRYRFSREVLAQYAPQPTLFD